MSKRHAQARRPARHGKWCTPALPGPAGLYGPRHLSALRGLLLPPALDRVADADMPDRPCLMPPAEVVRTLAGTAAVVRRLGQEPLLDGPVLGALAEAARHGWGLAMSPEHAKALWRFCEAFSGEEPLLRGASRGLRVHVG